LYRPGCSPDPFSEFCHRPSSLHGSYRRHYHLIIPVQLAPKHELAIPRTTSKRFIVSVSHTKNRKVGQAEKWSKVRPIHVSLQDSKQSNLVAEKVLMVM